MKLLNRVLLVVMSVTLASCAGHPKRPPAPVYHQWNVTYPPALVSASGDKVNFYLNFNDELGLLQVTVAGTQEMFAKGNIGARWHGVGGDILDPAQSSLDTPGTVVNGLTTRKGEAAGTFIGSTTNWVGTALFSKQSHVLDNGWMEVMIGQDWFWLEVPSGLTLSPGTPPASARPESNLVLPSGVGQMTAKDHIMRWNDLTCNNLRFTKPGEGHYWTNQTPAVGTFR